MIFFLTLKSLAKRKLSAMLCIFSVALSVALYLGVTRLKRQAENSFMSTVSGVDLVVGARSGEMNLILYTLFHLGSPVNNVRYESYEQIKNNPSVKWTIPISLGDSFRGHRVIGTNQDLFHFYQYGEKKKLSFAKGNAFRHLFEVVVGNEVAQKQQLKLGDSIHLTHGGGSESILEHDNIKFKIVGILKPTATPMDKAVFTSLEAIEAIHLGWETGAPENVPLQSEIQLAELRPEAITSFLLATKSKFQLLRLRHQIANFRGEPLSAIIPGLALSKLWSLLGDVEKSLLFISVCVLFVGIISIVVSLINTLQARKKEIAVLRAIGASPLQVAGLFLVEGPLLTFLGIVLGIVLLGAAQLSLLPKLSSAYQVNLEFKLVHSEELKILTMFFAAGIFSGILPGIFAYRGSLHKNFQD